MNDSQSSSDAAATRDMVGVHLSIPAHPVIARAYPANNIAATELLGVLLEKALVEAGQFQGEARSSGQFNDSIYFYLVADARAATAVLKGELEKHALLTWAQVAYICRHEEIWRTVHPLPEPADFEQFAKPAYLEAKRAEMLELRAAIARALS